MKLFLLVYVMLTQVVSDTLNLLEYSSKDEKKNSTLVLQTQIPTEKIKEFCSRIKPCVDE